MVAKREIGDWCAFMFTFPQASFQAKSASVNVCLSVCGSVITRSYRLFSFFTFFVCLAIIIIHSPQQLCELLFDWNHTHGDRWPKGNESKAEQNWAFQPNQPTYRLTGHRSAMCKHSNSCRRVVVVAVSERVEKVSTCNKTSPKLKHRLSKINNNIKK